MRLWWNWPPWRPPPPDPLVAEARKNLERIDAATRKIEHPSLSEIADEMNDATNQVRQALRSASDR